MRRARAISHWGRIPVTTREGWSSTSGVSPRVTRQRLLIRWRSRVAMLAGERRMTRAIMASLSVATMIRERLATDGIVTGGPPTPLPIPRSAVVAMRFTIAVSVLCGVVRVLCRRLLPTACRGRKHRTSVVRISRAHHRPWTGRLVVWALGVALPQIVTVVHVRI